MAGVSIVGCISGGTQIDVIPLRFAALSSFLIAMFFSEPISPSLPQISTNPGKIILSFAFISRSDLKPFGSFLSDMIFPLSI